jgi:hypothetical protein
MDGEPVPDRPPYRGSADGSPLLPCSLLRSPVAAVAPQVPEAPLRQQTGPSPLGSCAGGGR